MRRRRDQARDYLKPADPDIIAITIQEIVALVEVLEHAHVQISKLSNSDSETIINASGSALIPSLYARAGWSRSRGIAAAMYLCSSVKLHCLMLP